ncbi:hypothetical protein GC194_06190 [bacterium]|nr:hypothetical protein [bacterium]
MAFQLLLPIGGCTWLGNYLDHKFGFATHWLTIALGLFGVAAGLYLSLKELLNSSDE